VAGTEAAVAAEIEVPALLGGDDAEVLAAGLGALAGAATDAALELVRSEAEAALAQAGGGIRRAIPDAPPPVMPVIE